jgi:hypothetical protein
MSQNLLLELSDEAYFAIRRQAEAAGVSPAQLVAASLEERFSGLDGLANLHPLLTEAQKQAARERFEHHFGAVNLGYATGPDNESIDADLAREYADSHEDD